MRGNSDQNLVVLTLYIIGVSYVFNLMVESIDDQVKFAYKKATVEDQLKEQNLQDQIGISFKLNASYSLGKPEEELKELLISIENKSDNLAIYVDWDSSTLVFETTKQSRRVIRKSPGLTRDLGVPQVPSLIAPKKTLSEAVTAENVFERDPVSAIYKPTSPLLDITGLKKSQKKLYNDFMNRRNELEFSLQLVIRIAETRVGLPVGINIPPVYIINCPFTVKKLLWTYALPWNKKK
ncbi:hypothetical protein I8751_05305 [Nostocaceae cyanobacterium CENA357]|uniref:Uncharacterized protein n=1 Tax=Atlanticothrix silvestris CENA357 TaxID=1725252 RepID=A0A8J7H9S2_9CYAN|nr:hypothetical protein [Atlanticothrix silvestris]MBH8551803.1 hypothetical protein [Atlanticothrix silvestris CENA357]